MRLLLLDIETAPALVYTWDLNPERISIDKISEPGYTLCFAAKWLGEDEVHFDSVKRSGMKKMLTRIHKLLDEADAVITYNGNRFDLPTLNKEFVETGMGPPSPYKKIDLLATAREQFRFTSNKLEWVARALGLGGKVAHKGMDLWKECMAGVPESWKQMEEYNKYDVVLLEKVYYKMRAWIRNHPNAGVYSRSDRPVCPHCEGMNLVKGGYTKNQSGDFARYKCKDCQTWSQAAIKERPGQAREHVRKQVT